MIAVFLTISLALFVEGIPTANRVKAAVNAKRIVVVDHGLRRDTDAALEMLVDGRGEMLLRGKLKGEFPAREAEELFKAEEKELQRRTGKSDWWWWWWW